MDLYCLIWAEPPVQFPFANLNSKAMDPCIYAFVKDANSIAQWSLPPSLCSLFLCHLSFSLCLSHTHSLYPIEMNDSIFALNDKIRLNKYCLLKYFWSDWLACLKRDSFMYKTYLAYSFFKSAIPVVCFSDMCHLKGAYASSMYIPNNCVEFFKSLCVLYKYKFSNINIWQYDIYYNAWGGTWFSRAGILSKCFVSWYSGKLALIKHYDPLLYLFVFFYASIGPYFYLI